MTNHNNISKKYIKCLLISIVFIFGLFGILTSAGINSSMNIEDRKPDGSNCNDYILFTNYNLDGCYYDPEHNRTGESWETAYIIENIELNNSVKYVYFLYTNRYVIIKDSVFADMNGQSVHIEPLIKITGSRNIKFENSTFSDNDVCLRMKESSNIAIESCTFNKNAFSIQMDGCNTIEIVKNVFTENYHAIEFYHGTNDVTIYYNSFINNIDVKYVYDQGLNNNWDNGTLGNYYSDYADTHPDADYDFTALALTQLNTEAESTGIIYGLGSEANGDDEFPYIDFELDLHLAIIEPIASNEFKLVPDIEMECNAMFMNVSYFLADQYDTATDLFTYPNQITQADWDELEDGQITIYINATTVLNTEITEEIIIVKNTLGPAFTLDYAEYCKCPAEFDITPIDAIDHLELNITGIIIEVIPSESLVCAIIPQMVWYTLQEGEQSIRITAKDSVGNSLTKIAVYVKDTIRPNITETALLLSITDPNLNYSEVKLTRIRTMESTIYSNIQHLNIEQLELEGKYIIHAFATDLAGNCMQFSKIIGSESTEPKKHLLSIQLWCMVITCASLVVSIITVSKMRNKRGGNLNGK
ncbi:MAG: hypothetical protein GF364_13090 [Candidatus Lokiarchaeota archaeon]|nr:hypothetical protein [Candidatus Lokiarchaeota archaeon]